MALREEIVDPTVEQTHAFFEVLRAEHRPQWIELLNSIRFAELRGAGYLSYLAEVLDDPAMMARMTKHAADEGKHAHFVTLMIRRDGGQPKSMLDRNLFKSMAQARGEGSYQGGPPLNGCPERDELIEVFAGMQAVEHAARTAFQAMERLYENDPVVLSMVKEVLRDEEFHINWIAKVLERWSSEGRAGQIDDARWRARKALADARADSIRSQIEAAASAEAAQA